MALWLPPRLRLTVGFFHVPTIPTNHTIHTRSSRYIQHSSYVPLFQTGVRTSPPPPPAAFGSPFKILPPRHEAGRSSPGSSPRGSPSSPDLPSLPSSPSDEQPQSLQTTPLKRMRSRVTEMAELIVEPALSPEGGEQRSLREEQWSPIREAQWSPLRGVVTATEPGVDLGGEGNAESPGGQLASEDGPAFDGLEEGQMEATDILLGGVVTGLQAGVESGGKRKAGSAGVPSLQELALEDGAGPVFSGEGSAQGTDILRGVSTGTEPGVELGGEGDVVSTGVGLGLDRSARGGGPAFACNTEGPELSPAGAILAPGVQREIMLGGRENEMEPQEECAESEDPKNAGWDSGEPGKNDGILLAGIPGVDTQNQGRDVTGGEQDQQRGAEVRRVGQEGLVGAEGLVSGGAAKRRRIEMGSAMIEEGVSSCGGEGGAGLSEQRLEGLASKKRRMDEPEGSHSVSVSFKSAQAALSEFSFLPNDAGLEGKGAGSGLEVGGAVNETEQRSGKPSGRGGEEESGDNGTRAVSHALVHTGSIEGGNKPDEEGANKPELVDGAAHLKGTAGTSQPCQDIDNRDGIIVTEVSVHRLQGNGGLQSNEALRREEASTERGCSGALSGESKEGEGKGIVTEGQTGEKVLAVETDGEGLQNGNDRDGTRVGQVDNRSAEGACLDRRNSSNLGDDGVLPNESTVSPSIKANATDGGGKFEEVKQRDAVPCGTAGLASREGMVTGAGLKMGGESPPQGSVVGLGAGAEGNKREAPREKGEREEGVAATEVGGPQANGSGAVQSVEMHHEPLGRGEGSGAVEVTRGGVLTTRQKVRAFEALREASQSPIDEERAGHGGEGGGAPPDRGVGEGGAHIIERVELKRSNVDQSTDMEVDGGRLFTLGADLFGEQVHTAGPVHTGGHLAPAPESTPEELPAGSARLLPELSKLKVDRIFVRDVPSDVREREVAAGRECWREENVVHVTPVAILLDDDEASVELEEEFGLGGTVYYWVKWEGYPHVCNEWVPRKELERLSNGAEKLAAFQREGATPVWSEDWTKLERVVARRGGRSMDGCRGLGVSRDALGLSTQGSSGEGAKNGDESARQIDEVSGGERAVETRTETSAQRMKREESMKGRSEDAEEFLVKWKGLGYGESSWERGEWVRGVAGGVGLIER
jgi:hypothetical protein